MKLIRPVSVVQSFALSVVIFATAILFGCNPVHAQTQTTSPLYAGLNQAFDLNDTNSLVNANEINITPFTKWNSATSKLGGGINADWWVTDQQGAFLGFEEYSDRKSYFSFGYGARTVFKIVEVGVKFGTRQDNDDPFGQVDLFLRPSASVRIVDWKDVDLRVEVGADILNRGRPNPYFGLTLRAFRF